MGGNGPPEESQIYPLRPKSQAVRDPHFPRPRQTGNLADRAHRAVDRPAAGGKHRYLAQQVPSAELGSSLKDGTEVDVERLLVGTQWLMSIVHNESNGRTYANVDSAMKATAEQQIAIWDDGNGF